MELDLVDAIAEAIVRPEARRVLVRQAPPHDGFAGQKRTERHRAIGRPARALRSSASTSGRFSRKRLYPSIGGG
jgi:hypothetical protein